MHTPAKPNMPYVWHPPVTQPGTETNIICQTNPTLCNPDPRPPVDPTLDNCFWNGDCTEF